MNRRMVFSEKKEAGKRARCTSRQRRLCVALSGAHLLPSLQDTAKIKLDSSLSDAYG
jgi:hypothetical protein